MVAQATRLHGSKYPSFSTCITAINMNPGIHPLLYGRQNVARGPCGFPGVVLRIGGEVGGACIGAVLLAGVGKDDGLRIGVGFVGRRRRGARTLLGGFTSLIRVRSGCRWRCALNDEEPDCWWVVFGLLGGMKWMFAQQWCRSQWSDS